MNIKHTLLTIFIFAITNASTVAPNIDLTPPVVGVLNIVLTPPVRKGSIYKKVPGSKYSFELIAPNNLEQYSGKPCMFCPLISSFIVEPDNPDQCDALAIIILSDKLSRLEESNKYMEGTIEAKDEVIKLLRDKIDIQKNYKNELIKLRNRAT
jgi:hypothetical protein